MAILSHGILFSLQKCFNCFKKNILDFTHISISNLQAKQISTCQSFKLNVTEYIEIGYFDIYKCTNKMLSNVCINKSNWLQILKKITRRVENVELR